MSPTTWTIMIMSLLTSTAIVMSSHHWILAWLGLELNTMSILPLIIKSHHPRATEAATKYFLVQTTAAALILLAGLLNTWQTGQWAIMHITPEVTVILTVALMLKLGLAPGHFWFPEVLQGSTLLTALIISTWQKLAPLAILYLISQTPSTAMLTIGLLSTLIGGLMGLNQTQTRKLLAFSSIAHMGWLVTALTLSPKLATLTMMMYIFNTTAVFLALAPTATKTIPDLSTLHAGSPILTTLMLISIMSLGGLPPLSGFLPKWLILNALVTKNLSFLAIMFALSSLPSLYFYTRVTYITTLTIPPNNLTAKHMWRFKSSFPASLTMLVSLTTLLLPLTFALTNTM
uniref:NADH-ubiquinone oxidoreductase chain 2 n=1 Tax=Lygodactylus angularis TaxID=983886 RepID=A0A077H3D0_9SAUR|nr:NADH dehydrogenase subunit 2 [Lygodactylus angularis]